MSTFHQSDYDFSVFPTYPQGFNNLRALKPLPEGTHEAFAQRNGLKYTGLRSRNNDWPDLQTFGIRFNPKLKSKILWQFDGDHNGTSFTLACTVESHFSYYSASATYTTLAVIPLPRQLPQIALSSLLRHSMVPKADWTRQFAANQRVLSDSQIFNDYWAVYAPAAYTPAVQKTLLTEQFMDTLLQYASGFDIAIVNDKLFLLSDAQPLFREGFVNLFTVVEAVIDSLRAMSELPEVAAHATTTDIRLQTRRGVSRLAFRSTLMTLAVCILASLVVVALAGYSTISPTAWVVLIVAIVLLLATYFIMGPDKSVPKQPKNAQALVDRFGKVVAAYWQFTA